MVEANRPRFLPGLKRLMDCVVLWLVGNIQAAACETDEKVQRTPCCCGKHSFPTFELETLDWSWEPIVEDGGRHEVDGCMHHELIRGTNIGSVPLRDPGFECHWGQGVKEG
jgi:hypothetical protein